MQNNMTVQYQSHIAFVHECSPMKVRQNCFIFLYLYLYEDLRILCHRANSDVPIVKIPKDSQFYVKKRPYNVL